MEDFGTWQTIVKWSPWAIFILAVFIAGVTVLNKVAQNKVDEFKEQKQSQKLDDIHEATTDRDSSRDALYQGWIDSVSTAREDLLEENPVDAKGFFEGLEQEAANKVAKQQKAQELYREKKRIEQLQLEEHRKPLEQMANHLRSEFLRFYEDIKVNLAKNDKDKKILKEFSEQLKRLDGDIYFPIQYKEKYATFGSRDSSIGITIDLDKNITIHHDYDSDNDATHGTFVFGNESHVGDMSKVMKNHLLERIERVILDHRVAVIKEEMNVE